MLVVERLVVRDAGPPGVDLRATEFLGRDILAGRGLHQRRPAEEDRPRALHDDRLVAHRRHVGAASGTRAHDECDLRDPCGRHAGLVVEDPAEVVAVREDVRLERQEGTAAVDEIDARQPVLERDVLRPEVFLDGHRVIRAALDRGVVGDDDAGRVLHPADPGDDAGSRRVVVVQAVRGERAQLEEGRTRIEQVVDAVTDRELAPFAMALDRGIVAAGASVSEVGLSPAQVVDQDRHRLVVRACIRRGRVQPATQDGHGPDDRSRNRAWTPTVRRACRCVVRSSSCPSC